MKQQDFGKQFPGRLVTIAGGNCAFVPDKLPPRCDLGTDVIDANERAVGAIGELRATIPFLPNPNLFTAPFLRREAVLSSKIEGTHTELTQLYLFEINDAAKSDDSTDDRRDAREVLNYVEALVHGLQRLKSLPICKRLLREVHEKLLHRSHRYDGSLVPPGEFRNSQAFIGRDKDIATARYVAPPADGVEELLDDLEGYINAPKSEHPSLVRIAICHYQFEAIHPFGDGNGRVGRVLISLLLAAWELLPEPLLYLSAYFERNRDDYMQRLWGVSREGLWNEWILFFLEGVFQESNDAVTRAREMLNLRESYRAKLQTRRGSGGLLALTDELFRHPVISVNRARKLLGVAYNSAQNNIDKLVEAGILMEYTGRRRNRLYAANEILEILH